VKKGIFIMAAESSASDTVAAAGPRKQLMEQGWSDSGPLIRRWLGEATSAMLGMAGVKSGAHVLDVAAGAGGQTLDIARRVGPRGFVLATDLSPDILQFAKRQAAEAGYRNVEILTSDGENLQIEDARFDAVVCRMGLMLFLDPLQGLREMKRVLKPGGGVCAMVFSAPDNNPCIATLMSIALRHAGLAARDPYQPGGLFSLGKPGSIDGLFDQAGLRAIATTTIAAPFKLPTARDYVNFVRATAGLVVQIVQRLEPAKARAAWADMERALSRFGTADGWEGPNELLLTAARR
jgi:SAM-dependent methyltransferase